VHNRFIPAAARALSEALRNLAEASAQGQRTRDLRPLARRLELLADRRRAMPLPARKP